MTEPSFFATAPFSGALENEEAPPTALKPLGLMQRIAKLFRPRPHRNLRLNFERFGALFGAQNIEEYEAQARQFFREGITTNAPAFSVVEFKSGKIGVDYNGEKRGIYLRNGTPLAFFRPNFREMGYTRKEDELNDWKAGKLGISS